MKWLVLVLLLLNVALFGFLWSNPQFGEPRVVESAYQATDVPGLVLLSEVPDPPKSGSATWSDGDADALPSGSGAPPEAAQVPPDSVAAADAASTPQTDRVVPQGPVEDAQAATCYRVGPVVRRDDALELQRRFAGAALSGTVAEETRTELRHWIHLRGATSRQEARDLIMQLDERGFTDHLILNDPDELHTISLGVFRDRDRSERLLQQLRDAHFPAGLSPREVQTRVFWVEFPGLADGQRRTLEELVAAQRNSEIGVAGCAVASS